MSQPYEFQSIDHDASISVAPDPESPEDMVIVRITIESEAHSATASIVMWREEFDSMAQSLPSMDEDEG